MKKRNFTQLDAVQAYTKKGATKGANEKAAIRAIARILALLILFLIGIFFLLRLPLFRYKSIDIRTNADDAETYQEFANTLFDQSSFFLPRGSIFLVRQDAIQESFVSTFDLLRAEVTSYERLITVDITPEPKASLLRLNGVEYAISFDGVIGDDISVVSQNNPILIIQEGEGDIANGSQLLSSERMASLHIMANTFESVIATNEIVLEQSGSIWAELQSIDGHAILFELDDNPDLLFDRYTKVVEQYQDELDQLSYIDLRFGNKVFVK